MNLKNLLKEFVNIYLETEYLGETPKFSEECLKVNFPFLKGELLEYYQHILLEKECYFGNEFFCLVLLPYSSKRTTIEHWALQEHKEFSEKQYMIFACTDIDEIIFCDMKSEKSPVYGGIPGDPDFYKLSGSLTEFLQLYIELTKLELDTQFKNDLEFKENAIPLVEKYISPEAQETCKEFIFH